MSAYYNENDPVCASVLEALIADGIIAPGDVDNRSILEVTPDDIRGYKQCHFFAGGGFWSIAARQAGWPDEKPLWTGSCPCQPFSVVGRRKGTDDKRHLWPDFFRLIRESQPPIVAGEQVSGKPGYGWLDGVCDDLETENYTCGAQDIAACAINAPHQRSRLYWFGKLADSSGKGLQGYGEHGVPSERRENQAGQTIDANASYWSNASTIKCYDGKYRRTKPGTLLLVDGISLVMDDLDDEGNTSYQDFEKGRIEAFKIAGNAIVPQLAAEFLKSL